jgi:hypothetical protein
MRRGGNLRNRPTPIKGATTATNRARLEPMHSPERRGLRVSWLSTRELDKSNTATTVAGCTTWSAERSHATPPVRQPRPEHTIQLSFAARGRGQRTPDVSLEVFRRYGGACDGRALWETSRANINGRLNKLKVVKTTA